LLFLHWVFSSGKPISAERIHTEHDPELGWINRPKVHIPDLYGPGIALSTNSLRMRSSFPLPDPDPTSLRFICSGDSFTLGYGVADDETWCHLLEDATNGQAFNMGQGGYGLDQIYLWYKRDGAQLSPHVHIVAITLQDLVRMQYSSFLGYPKPQLSLQGDSLITVGVPVPKPDPFVSWRRALQQAALDLRLAQLIGNRSDSRSFDPPNYSQITPEVLAMTRALLRDLKTGNDAARIRTLVVLLPIRGDLLDSVPLRQLIKTLREILDNLGIQHLDLIAAMQQTTKSEIATFFIPAGVVDYPGAAGHYTAAGNGWVTRQIATSFALK